MILGSALLAADVFVYRDRIHPGVEVGGVSLGGLRTAEAARALADRAAELRGEAIRFHWGGRTFVISPVELGWRPDPDGTATAALRIGRSGPPWEAIPVRALAWLRPVKVPWQGTWDDASLDRVVAGWTEEVGLAPREGRVWVEGGSVRTKMPAPGRGIDRGAVAALASAVLDGGWEGPLPLPVVPADPVTTAADITRALEEVRLLIAAPVSVTMGDLGIRISPEEIGELVRTRVERRGPGDGRLQVRFSPTGVAALFEPYRSDVERAPRPAGFVTDGPTVRITRSSPGRTLDPRLAAERFLRTARSEDRTGRVPLARTQPSFTTRDARAMGIAEEVASFTTYHAAGEPRVQNIHLAADLLDGSIVGPGGTFSMNGRIGNRTPERGFVEAPVIYDGEFTTDVGGGVSQLATTLFNAAFFGGYPFLEHQPHSVYISRYPMGREATVSWPQPDLVFENDTRTALLIETEYTESSITVRIFGDRHGRIVTATDPVITERGKDGYRVLVERIVEKRGEEIRRDTFVTYYRQE